MLGKSTADEAATMKAEEERLLQLAEHSKNEAIEHFRKDKKNKGKDPPKEVTLTPQVIEYNNYIESKSASVSSLATITEFRMKWKDVGYGIVLDSVNSKFFPIELVAQSIQKALPAAVFVHISVDKGEEGYSAWLAHLYELKVLERENLLKSLESTKKAILKNFKPPKGSDF